MDRIYQEYEKEVESIKKRFRRVHEANARLVAIGMGLAPSLTSALQSAVFHSAPMPPPQRMIIPLPAQEQIRPENYSEPNIESSAEPINYASESLYQPADLKFSDYKHPFPQSFSDFGDVISK